MKILMIISLLTICNILYAQKKEVNVFVSPKIELVFAVFNLTDSGKELLIKNEKNFPKTGILIKPLIKYFEKYKNHPAVIKSDELLRSGYWWVSDMVDVVLCVGSFPMNKIEYKISDTTQKAQIEREWLSLMNQFYIDTKFGEYIDGNNYLYKSIISEVKSSLPKEDVIGEMERFYRTENKSYNLIPCPLMWGGLGWGLGPHPEKGVINNIFAWFDDPKIDSVLTIKPNTYWGFGSQIKIRELTTHEFGHGFVNDIVNANSIEVDKYSSLIDTIYSQMKKQSYRRWRTCLAEHIVRMGEIRVADRLGLKDNSIKLLSTYVNENKFIYLPTLLESINEYEANIDKYKRFEDYFPILLKSLDKFKE